MKQVENFLIKNFSELTDQDLKKFYNFYLKKLITWMSKANKYLALDKNQQEKQGQIEKSLINVFSQGVKQSPLKQAMKDLSRFKQSHHREIQSKDLILEGYELLNSLGEQIRGSQILYSITVTSDNEKIGASTSSNQKVWTIQVPFNEFKNLITSSGRRKMVLKENSAIVKMLEAKNSPLKEMIEEWTPEKINNFMIFNNQIVKNKNWTQWHKINQGNVLEAYLRFLNQGDKVQYPGNSEYFSRLGSTVRNTMATPAIFYKGGDVNNIQIKGSDASIVSLSTLIIHVNSIIQILSYSQDTQAILSKYIKQQNISDYLEKTKNKTVEEVKDALIREFTDSINRTISRI